MILACDWHCFSPAFCTYEISSWDGLSPSWGPSALHRRERSPPHQDACHQSTQGRPPAVALKAWDSQNTPRRWVCLIFIICHLLLDSTLPTTRHGLPPLTASRTGSVARLGFHKNLLPEGNGLPFPECLSDFTGSLDLRGSYLKCRFWFSRAGALESVCISNKPPRVMWRRLESRARSERWGWSRWGPSQLQLILFFSKKQPLFFMPKHLELSLLSAMSWEHLQKIREWSFSPAKPGAPRPTPLSADSQSQPGPKAHTAQPQQTGPSHRGTISYHCFQIPRVQNCTWQAPF